MIEIELDICDDQVPATYVMGAGEIESLYLVIDGEHVPMNELLYVDSVTEAITNHYDSLLLEA